MVLPAHIRAARSKEEARRRFADVRVLIADHDVRIAHLVRRVLSSFGFSNAELVSSSERVLQRLQQERFDIIVTEKVLEPLDGIELVRAVRAAGTHGSLRRDLPMIMLTAHSERESVEAARDAGISEFIAKPFSAATISSRLIQVIDNPRPFVEANLYVGPCRRRRGEPPPGMQERRGARAQEAIIIPANTSLRDQMGTNASIVLGDMELVARAQNDLLAVEGEFLEWARDDMQSLEKAYMHLARDPSDMVAHALLLDVAYAIKSQSGIFGYGLGTEVAGMLIDYMRANGSLDVKKLMVIRKHIDVIEVIFRQKIKEGGERVGRDLIASLHQLIRKLG